MTYQISYLRPMGRGLVSVDLSPRKQDYGRVYKIFHGAFTQLVPEEQPSGVEAVESVLPMAEVIPFENVASVN